MAVSPVNTDLNTLQIDPDCSTLQGQAQHCHEIEKMLSALPCPYNSHISTTRSIKYNTHLAQDSQNNKTETK